MGIPFKLYEGKEANLPAELTAGGIYFCEDSGNVFIDVDMDGTLTRIHLGKKYIDDQLVDIREFIENQGSGIEIGDKPPTKESANVWINTNDEDGEGVEYLGVVTSINGKGGDINITASDIDAAPAGYGLGNNDAKQLTSTDLLDNVIDGGWYYWNTYSSDGIPADIPFNIQLGCMRVDNGSFYGYRVQTVYDMGSIYAVQRRIGGSAVVNTPWEYINPPITPGAEYRTTERYNGKSVYVQAIKVEQLSVGSTSNTAQKYFHIGYNIEDVISQSGQYVYPSTSSEEHVVTVSYNLPFIDYQDVVMVSNNVVIDRDNNNLGYGFVYTKLEPPEGAFALITVKYTKTTD